VLQNCYILVLSDTSPILPNPSEKALSGTLPLPRLPRLEPLSNRPFRELPDHELERLSDDELLAYIRQARDAGAHGAAKRALAFLVFGYMDVVRYRVWRRVPEHDVDEVAGRALESAIVAAFEGNSQGEFRSFMHTIVARRIADYHRRRENDPDFVSLNFDPDQDWGPELAVEPEGTALDAQRAVDQAYAELKPEHQEAIGLYVFEDKPAGEVAEATGLSEANVHQIASRFRRRVREILEQGDTST